MPKRNHSASDNEDVAEASSSTTKRKRQSMECAPGPDIDITANDADTPPTRYLDVGQSLAPLVVGDDGYAEGSIISIVLRNFVTYGYCEFHPGPQLNLIIGPNGSGKSTIVCALALGLGSSPALLGRAQNIADFVKSGESHGSIQIELSKALGQNIVIQRNINKENNSSTWKLNGQSSSYKSVMTIVTGLRIQVDNLCQFLPQDRVAEFAQLTPPLLLIRTLEVVGVEVLQTQLNELIEKRKKQRQLEKSIASDETYRNSLQIKTQLVGKDVEKIKQRQELTNEIILLEATIPLTKFSDAKKQLVAAKEKERLARAEKSRLDREIAPLNLALETCKTESEADIKQRSMLVEHVTENIHQHRSTAASIEKLVQETKQTSNAIKGLKTRGKCRQEDMKKLEQKISELETTVSVEPPMEDSELERNMELKVTKINEVSLLISDMMDTAKEYSHQKKEHEKQIGRKKTEIDQLKDISRVRLSLLQRHYNDAFKAHMWYRENKALFRGRIFGPIQLSLSLKDKEYTDYVETALGGKNSSHLQTFVCEYAEDYKVLMKELVDLQQLRLTASWPGDIDIEELTKTPCTEQKLKEIFGLDHFVANLLDGPPLVIAYLCQQANINCIPVSLKRVSIEKIVDQSNFQRFLVAGNFYQVRKYTYGLGGTQTTVRPISPAAVLTDKVDKDLYERKHEELKQLEMTGATIDFEMQKLATKQKEHIQKLNELKHQREHLKVLKRDILVKHSQWDGQKKRLARYRQDLKVMVNKPLELEQEIESLEIQIVDKTKRRGKLVMDYSKKVGNYVTKVMQRNKVSLDSLLSHAKYEGSKMHSKSQQARANRAVKEYQKAQKDTIARKAVLQSRHQEADQVGKDLPKELKEKFKQICEDMGTDGLDKTQEQIEDDINDLQARKNAIVMTNPVAVSTYEKLLAETKNLDQKIQGDKNEAETLSKEIAEICGHWETRLGQLVSRIDEKFAIGLDRIGCAGQVEIGRDEAFEKWGIEIRVKFRDNEKLQLLTGQRQSGGERAVSTILYLMALQNLSRTPFRVVDEINQGMDPRNERMIHEEIIKGASLSGTSQYFIITPKLLPDLYYDDCMRVLCIYNGEWQPKKLKSVALYLQQHKLTETPS